MLGIGVESVIILFGDNIYLCTSVNLAGKGVHVCACIMGVCCDLYFGHDFVMVFRCSMLAIVEVLGLSWASSDPRKTLS